MSGGSSANSATFWLVIWTLNNIGVTLLNKAVFSKVDFHYPFFLSAVHMICNSLGASLIFWNLERSSTSSKPPNSGGSISSRSISSNCVGSFLQRLLGDMQRQNLTKHGQRLILAFSVIFSLNIAIGNLALKYTTVNFNQVMRSCVPALTIAMGLCLGKKFSTRRKLAVLPIIIGVAMACFGDMSYSALGFFFTCCCVFLAALKVVASGEMLTGSSIKLHPVDLLGHMAPLALIQCMALSFCTGEIKSIASRWHTELSPFTADPYPMTMLWVSGIFSFSLNICSLQANKMTSPLTLCIAANVKQVLMIAASTLLFGIEISPLNGAGIVVVLIGSARYSYISVLEKQQQQGGISPKPSRDTDEEAAASATDEMIPLAKDTGHSTVSVQRV